MGLRIVFFGTPEFAVPTLTSLCNSQHSVCAVFTQPPRPSGRRGLKCLDGPVAEQAMKLGLTIYHPKSLQDLSIKNQLRDFNADVFIVVAYGLILPTSILEIPRLGCYNAHASLLPRWRGAAPIERALMEGDTETGVSIIKMDSGLDSGAIVQMESEKITRQMTSEILRHRLSKKSASLILKTLRLLETGNLSFLPQPTEGITYASKIKKDELRISWSDLGDVIERKIRAFSPSPGAWCVMEINGRSERIKILAGDYVEETLDNRDNIFSSELFVPCQKGGIKIKRLQRSGGKTLSVDDFLRGARVTRIF